MSQPAETGPDLGPASARVDESAAAELAAVLARAVDAEPGDVPCIYGLRLVSQLAQGALEGRIGDGLVALHEAQSIRLVRPLARSEEISLRVRIALAGPALGVLAQGDAADERIFESDTRIRLVIAGAAAELTGAARAWQPRADDLPPLVSRVLDAELVSAYARAAADPNPIHTDAAAARAAGFAGPIVHGMLVAGLAEPALRRLGLGDGLSTMRVRFLAPVPVGASVTLRIRALSGKGFRIAACRPDGAVAAISDVAVFV